MTAEVVVMNQHAVAMAADSAVTVGREKVFHTANKIFALSKFRPVGVMVYGSGDFMEIPWETLIKVFRQQLGRAEFGHLSDYAAAFLRFLEDPDLFPAEKQRSFVESRARAYLTEFEKRLTQTVSARLIEQGRLLDPTEADIQKLIRSMTVECVQELAGHDHERMMALAQAGEACGVPKSAVEEEHGQFLRAAVEDVLGYTAIGEDLLDMLQSNLVLCIVCPCFPGVDGEWSGTSSGIVVAGFGQKQMFPSFQVHSVWGVAADQLLCSSEETREITAAGHAWVKALAQPQVVHTFMEGCDPTFWKYLVSSLTARLSGVAEAMSEAMDGLDAEARNSVRQTLSQVLDDEITSWTSDLWQWRRENLVRPFTSGLSAVPTGEMGEVAEALVHLTSLRAKVSPTQETVGGPIDVAVISKGEGLVWIARKHYFDQKLNPHFSTRYFEED